VQTITLSRAIAALLFISIGLRAEYRTTATILFSYACITDVLDGYLARKLNCQTKAGGAFDLFSDKYLTIISLTYAIARGMPIVACSIAILRECFLLSMRSIYLNQKPLFPPERMLGTITIIPIWAGTLLLLNSDIINLSKRMFFVYYWSIGLLTFANLTYKLISNRKALLRAFKSD
jgi:phosphatidylglycerophosphate synthase